MTDFITSPPCILTWMVIDEPREDNKGRLVYSARGLFDEKDEGVTDYKQKLLTINDRLISYKLKKEPLPPGQFTSGAWSLFPPTVVGADEKVIPKDELPKYSPGAKVKAILQLKVFGSKEGKGLNLLGLAILDYEPGEGGNFTVASLQEGIQKFKHG